MQRILRASAVALGLTAVTALAYRFPGDRIYANMSAKDAESLRQAVSTLIVALMSVIAALWAVSVSIYQTGSRLLERRRAISIITVAGGVLLWLGLAVGATSLSSSTSSFGVRISVATLAVCVLIVLGVVLIILGQLR